MGLPGTRVARAGNCERHPAHGLCEADLVTFGPLCAVALSGLFLFQHDLQYFPARRDPVPEAVGLEVAGRVMLATPDGERLVLWRGAAAPGRPTILLLHGNAGAMADRADRLTFYRSLKLGVAFRSLGPVGHEVLFDPDTWAKGADFTDRTLGHNGPPEEPTP